MYIFTVLLMLSFFYSLESSVNLHCDSVPKPASATAGNAAGAGTAPPGGGAVPAPAGTAPPGGGAPAGAFTTAPPPPPLPARTSAPAGGNTTGNTTGKTTGKTTGNTTGIAGGNMTSNGSNVGDPDSRVCGKNYGPTQKFKRQNPRFKYRRDTHPDVDSANAPWLVIVEPSYKLRSKVITESNCTGILISRKFVLSAASCIPLALDYAPGYALWKMQIILGFGTADEDNKNSPQSHVTVHPEYNPVRKVTSVDIALIQIPTQHFTYSISPCCMGTCNVLYGAANTLQVDASYFSGERDPTKGEMVEQEVSATASTADTGDCLAKRPGLDPEKHFCVDPVTTCYGEQGGSITRPLGTNNFQLVGVIISDDCDASKPMVAVYLRYISEWILSVTKEDFP